MKKKTQNKFHYMYLHHAVILLISVTHTKIKSLYNFLRKKLNWNEKCIGKMECGKILYVHQSVQVISYMAIFLQITDPILSFKLHVVPSYAYSCLSVYTKMLICTTVDNIPCS